MSESDDDPPPPLLPAQLVPEDEGELAVQIGIVPGPAGPVIVIQFGKPVSWLGLGADHAREFAAMLIARADQIDEEGSDADHG